MQCSGGFKTVYVGNAKIINFPNAGRTAERLNKLELQVIQNYLGTLHQWNRMIMTETAPSGFQWTTLRGEVSTTGS